MTMYNVFIYVYEHTWFMQVTSNFMLLAAKTCPPIEDELEQEASEVTCPDATTADAGCQNN